MKNILCYGDSNTWGFNPIDGSRYEKEVRWTGVLEKELGGEYRIIENGINGRTTVFDNPYAFEYQNGFKGLFYALNASKPLDAIVLMLGTNYLNYTDAEGVYKGLYKIINLLQNASLFFSDTTKGSSPIWRDTQKILLVSPIFRNRSNQMNQEQEEKRNKESLLFPYYTKKLAEEFGINYFDASKVAHPSVLDGLHMDAENHRTLGLWIAKAIKEIFE